MNTKITLIREWDSRGRRERLSSTAAEAPNLAYPVTPFLAQARSQGVTPRSLQRDRRDRWGAVFRAA